MPGSYTTTLGTREDYVMATPLVEFTDYDEYDLASIEEDLEHLSLHNNHLTYAEYMDARIRYTMVINYVQDCIVNRLLVDISNAKALLASQGYGVATKF